MQALGHKSVTPIDELGQTLSTTSLSATKASEERARKQEKAGLHLLQPDWETAIAQLSEEVRAEIDKLVSKKVIKEGELDSFELSTLATFTPQEGVEILRLFDCDNALKIGNKTGFLAGIIRRFSKKKIAVTEEKHFQTQEPERDEEDGGLLGPGGTSVEQRTHSRREKKRNEAQEIQLILEEEGVLDEEEGKQAEEVEKLTGCPVPLDVLLYAIPVCGPFSALRNFKYKVKLTPGTIKKGKACKNAIEVFVNSKNYAVPSPASETSRVSSSSNGIEQLESTNKERALIKGLTDPEMVAIMIGDVKLSMPGLYDTLKKKKDASKKAKSK